MKESLDKYDVLPEAMINYLRYNGRHFNKKLCEFAISNMTTSHGGSKLTKKQVDSMLTKYNIKIEDRGLWDYVYVANMCAMDFYGSSVPDEKHLVLYIKDVMDDKDGYDGLVFNRWYADTVRIGIPIDWYEYI